MISKTVASALALFVVFTSRLAAGEEAEPPRAAPPPVLSPVTHEETEQTVLGSDVSHGGYGAPEVKLTSLAGSAALLAGGEGGWIVGHRFILGGAGYALVSDVPSPDVLQPANGSRAHVSLGYGGIRLATVIAPHSVTHATLGILVGGGGVGSQTTSGDARRSDSFFCIEPDIAVETNLARHVRLDVGFGYRMIGGSELAGLRATALSGPVGLLAVKFGEF